MSSMEDGNKKIISKRQFFIMLIFLLTIFLFGLTENIFFPNIEIYSWKNYILAFIPAYLVGQTWRLSDHLLIFLNCLLGAVFLVEILYVVIYG